MASEADAKRLTKIRTRYEEASTDWSISANEKELFAVLAPKTAPVAIAEMTIDCGYVDRDFLLNAHSDIGFLLRLLKDAFAEIRRLKPPEDPQAVERRSAGRKQQEMEAHKDYAAECAMKCGDRLFRAFLVDRYQVPDVADAERIAVSVRNILRVASRGELNTDPAARARWIDFRSAFEAWRTHV
ncbi:hypothetical protein [Rhizobium mongolense]|uniref:Uncharacterized protein n=1 Tax=Rhizobium mongolense TaxID=57676 RepID=A0A7W6RQZ8_9HYPH|nr:hypothetical protein [Rhizobium mongolense]MBB4277059.1 hypothetical protein [Rhizobium mongolense]